MHNYKNKTYKRERVRKKTKAKHQRNEGGGGGGGGGGRGETIRVERNRFAKLGKTSKTVIEERKKDLTLVYMQSVEDPK